MLPAGKAQTRTIPPISYLSAPRAMHTSITTRRCRTSAAGWSDETDRPMARWTLEQIELQAVRGGVNREQAEQLVAEVRQLRAQVAILRGDDPLDVFAPKETA